MYTGFFVDKSSGTFADTLAAFGLASVVTDLMVRQQSSHRSVQIEDKGAYFYIICKPGIDEGSLEMLRQIPICPVKAIPTAVYSEEKRPAGIPLVDWDSVNNYLQTSKNSSGSELPPRPPDLDILLTINPDAIQGYNGLIFDWWIVREAQPEILRLLLNLHSQHPNRQDEAVHEWQRIAKAYGWKIDALITGQQLYNPDQGMGQNHPKSDTLDTAKKPKVNLWLVEWLRTVGFYQAAIPRLIGDRKTDGKDKDRKILVISPRNLTFAHHGEMMGRFQDRLTPESLTPVRFDIFAVIRYLQTLLIYFTEPEQADELESLGNIKTQVVSGFNIAYYKKMGKGRSLMNLSFIAIPGWITVRGEEDVRFYLELLDELEKHLRQLDESHSDVFSLLQHFRDFISSDDLTTFLKFSIAYAGYYMGQRDRNPFIQSLSTNLVKRMVQAMGKKFADIADSEKYPGFHNIARAISESTVIAQWRASPKQNNKTYEIRYGLHQELARQTQTTQKFLTALGEFIYTYNAETSRTQELGRKPWRPMVESTDIADVLRMIDDYEDSRMVAQLLIAFGSTFMLEKSTKNDQENE